VISFSKGISNRKVEDLRGRIQALHSDGHQHFTVLVYHPCEEQNRSHHEMHRREELSDQQGKTIKL